MHFEKGELDDQLVSAIKPFVPKIPRHLLRFEEGEMERRQEGWCNDESAALKQLVHKVDKQYKGMAGKLHVMNRQLRQMFKS
jgi:hypothetical protein